MSGLLHPDLGAVLDELDRWGERHDELCREYADATRKAHAAREERDRAYAVALQKADGATKEVREAQAYEETLVEHADLRAWDAEVDALKKLISAAERSQDRLRSRKTSMDQALAQSHGSTHRPPPPEEPPL